MENEYQVLNHLHENQITTQRKISQRTGLSLGAVNLLLKKMVRKGFVKVEKLDSRSVRYILTPVGLQEKAHLTYQFVRQSYKQILKINRVLDKLMFDYKINNNGDSVLLYGPADEIRDILTLWFKEQSINYMAANDLELNTDNQLQGDPRLVITWRKEEEKIVKELQNEDIVNIMKLI